MGAAASAYSVLISQSVAYLFACLSSFLSKGGPGLVWDSGTVPGQIGGRLGAGLPAAVQFVMSCRSICRRRTKPTVVIAID